MQDRSVFKPVNELELILATGLEGRLTARRLNETLLASQLHVMTDKEMQPGVWDMSAATLIVPSQRGFEVIPMFTSPVRYAEFPGWYPQFPHSQLVDFTWMLRGVGEGVGLHINPGWPVGLELQPDQVASLKASLPAA